jgi:hypothetical protein
MYIYVYTYICIYIYVYIYIYTDTFGASCPAGQNIKKADGNVVIETLLGAARREEAGRCHALRGRGAGSVEEGEDEEKEEEVSALLAGKKKMTKQEAKALRQLKAARTGRDKPSGWG